MRSNGLTKYHPNAPHPVAGAIVGGVGGLILGSIAGAAYVIGDLSKSLTPDQITHCTQAWQAASFNMTTIDASTDPVVQQCTSLAKADETTALAFIGAGIVGLGLLGYLIGGKM